MAEENDDIITTVRGGFGPDGITRTETTTTQEAIDIQGEQEGEPVLIDINDGAQEGDIVGEVPMRVDIEEARKEKEPETFGELRAEQSVEESNKEISTLLDTYEQVKIDEANKPGNKYVEAKTILSDMSSEVNKKTLELLAIKNPDYLNVEKGIVTNKKGEVIESKEDFIKATNFPTADVIYDQTSTQFKGEVFDYLKEQQKLTNAAWDYVKSSYKTETGNAITDLWMGTSETLDFGKYEEEIKIAVLNQLSGDRIESLANEGYYGKEGGFNLYGDKVPGILGAEAMTLKEKEILLANAKSIVLGNQLKIQNSARNNLKLLEEEFIKENKNLTEKQHEIQDLQKQMQSDLDALKLRYGTWGWDGSGQRKYITYGDLRDWNQADINTLKNINNTWSKISVDAVKLGIEREKVLALQKTYNDNAKDLTSSTEELFNTFLYDAVNNKFASSFRQTINDKAFNEMLRLSNPYMGPTLDVTSRFVNSYASYQLAGKVVGGLASVKGLAVAAVASVVGEVAYKNRRFSGNNMYSEARTMPFMQDMFNGLVSLTSKNLTPVSEDPVTKLTKEGYKSKSETWIGRFYDETLGEGSNWNPYSAASTVSDLLGYVMALKKGIGDLDAKHAARSEKLLGRVQSTDSKFGKSLAHSLSKGYLGSKKFTGVVEMVKVNQRITVLDNTADGLARGMDMLTATAYGNALSFMTGISQSIMPDYLWFNTSGGRAIKEGLIKKLTGKTIDKIATRNAITAASKQFGVNFFKEQLEEQVDLGLSDVVKTMFIAGHSPDILKANVQAEVLRGTTLLAGGLGSLQASRNYKAARSMTNRAFYNNGLQIIIQGQNQIKALKDRVALIKDSPLAKDKEFKKLLEQDIADLEQNVADGKDRLQAINAAPKLVTDEQIDLLIQKNKLIKERSALNKKDKALVSEELDAINKQISDIDIKIKESTPVKFKEQLYKTLAENTKRLAGKMGNVEHFIIDQKEYDKAVELQIQKITSDNQDIDNQIKQIDGSTPEGRKEITQLEARKLPVPTYEDPGIIIYDDTNNKHRILINEKVAKDSHNEAVALHELLHAVLRKTILNSPQNIKAISFTMRNELLKNPGRYNIRGNVGYITDINEKGKYDQYKNVVNDLAFDELFTVFSEALAQGNIGIESTAFSKISDFVRRSFREIGINFEVSSPRGMIRFLRDYNNEVMSGRNRFSRGMQKVIDNGLKINMSKESIAEAEKMEALLVAADKSKKLKIYDPKRSDSARSIKTKATRKDVYEQKKIQSDLEFGENTAKIVEENKRLRALILEENLKIGNKIVASEDLQNKLVENNLALAISLGNFAAKNPNIMGLEPGKRVTAQQFISGYYLELSDLARTYDASINEFGQYLNTILPLRYGQILEAEKAGAVEGSVDLDSAKDIAEDIDDSLTPDDVVVGPTVDTAERLGVKEETKPFVESKIKQVKKLAALREKISEKYSEKTAEQIAELESKGANDFSIEGLSVKQAPNLLYKFTSKLFGIDADKLNPKTSKWLANLRKNDKKGTNEVRSAQRAVVKNVQLILSTIFNEGHTKAFKSSGMPNSLLKFGYTKSSKRIGNNFPQYKKPNLSEKDLLEFVGVYKVGNKYEFKVDRNTSAKLLAIASMVDRNMSIQAINESLSESGDMTARARVALEDGMAKASKSIYYRENLELQPTINERLNSISVKIDGLDILDVKTIKKVIANEFDGTDVNGKAFANSLTKGYNIVGKFTDAVQRQGKRNFNKSFDEFAKEQLSQIALYEGLLDILGVDVKTKADLYTKKTIQNARSRVNDFILNVIVKEYNNSKKSKADKIRAMQLIYMLEQQHITAAKIANGKFEAITGTNEILEKSEEDIGTQRDQVFNNALDFRTWINQVLPTDLQVGLDQKANNKIKKDLSTKKKQFPNLSQQKSKNVISSLIDGTFNFVFRKNEAMLARDLVKEQVKFYTKHTAVNNQELAVHMLTFGSNMSTASRRAAYVYGVQEGLLSNGASGNYIYGNIDDAGQELEYEHGKPHEKMMLGLVSAALNNQGKKSIDAAMDNVFVDYEVNIITKKMDKTLVTSGVQKTMYPGYNEGVPQGWSQRLFNPLNFGHPDVGAILSLSGDGKTIGGAHSRITKAKILPKSVADIKRDQTISNGLNSARSIKYSEKIKGITVLDFDDTLATSKSKVLYTDPEGNEGTLTAEEFAKKGGDLLAQGYVYDFSEFSKVVGGKVAPLFNKALKLQSKFGPKNMFVLTARPADSAQAIFEFLQANGLKIPLKNITGLANSTPEAKAMWMAEKVGEGYNDFYFADDALQNVQAVANVLEQLDVKSKVQQAKLSRSINYNEQFNTILENTTNVGAEKIFSRAKAKMRGQEKGKYKIFIPPSADDFVGLIYSFLGKGKRGELDFKFFKDALIKPLNRAYIELNMARQSIATDYKKLTKEFPEIRKSLYKKLPGTEFTNGDAIRIYLWDKAGYTIPGLSTSDQTSLVKRINENAELKAFADAVGIISRVEEGYVKPNDNWQVEDIRVDLMNSMQNVHRKTFFAEFLENASVIFSTENLNKIEAIYGSNFREALEDMLYRIENGTNRSFGSNRLVNRFMNFINGSIGTTMFFNSRSAVLQTLSTVNFINWKENNPLAAAKAFANQKQFWSDFSMIFNSTFLKQRRAGLNIDVNASELTDFVSNSKEPIRSAINWLLTKGFLPTQMMDSFAIAMGGASYYRNNVNKRLAEGMSLKEAEEQAFLDMQEIAEETQQSARPDKISQQQASVLGRVILAFQNTPMQYTRLIKKAILDLQAGRGDAKSHISRIIYYGAIQNAIFYSLQTALFAMMFGDDDDEEFINTKTERVVDGSIDSILRGMGVGGAVVSTVKNMIKTVIDQKEKPRNRREEGAVLMEFLNLSPPIGIKARQVMSGSKTLNWNQDKIEKMPLYDLENPIWEAGFNYTQALTNVPLARLHNKVNNLREAASSDNETWQRIALFLGWSKWNLGIKDKKSKTKKKTKKRKRGAFGSFRTAG